MWYIYCQRKWKNDKAAVFEQHRCNTGLDFKFTNITGKAELRLKMRSPSPAHLTSREPIVNVRKYCRWDSRLGFKISYTHKGQTPAKTKLTSYLPVYLQPCSGERILATRAVGFRKIDTCFLNKTNKWTNTHKQTARFSRFACTVSD